MFSKKRNNIESPATKGNLILINTVSTDNYWRSWFPLSAREPRATSFDGVSARIRNFRMWWYILLEKEACIRHSLNYTTTKHLIKTELIGASLLKTSIYEAFSIFLSVKLRTSTCNHSLVTVYNKNQYQ